LLTRGTPFYVIGFGLAVLVRTGWPWATWTGLLATTALIGMSILYYSPVVMLPQRQPGPIDWLEDKLYTGLLFVAGALLLYEFLGRTLTPS
jgi:hypothetical protein